MSEQGYNIDYHLRAHDEMGQGFGSAKKEADGFFAHLQQKSKEFRRESAESGESTFKRYLNRGAEGLSDFGADAAGCGNAGSDRHDRW